HGGGRGGKARPPPPRPWPSPGPARGGGAGGGPLGAAPPAKAANPPAFPRTRVPPSSLWGYFLAPPIFASQPPASLAPLRRSLSVSMRRNSSSLPRNSARETSPSRLRSILRNQSGPSFSSGSRAERPPSMLNASTNTTA